jgi:hypothetical protein
MGAVNRLPLRNETLERLVVIPAQYQHPGLERTYQHLDYEVFYSGSEDWEPPVILVVEANCSSGIASFSADVTSDSGMHRVVVAYTDGSGEWQTVDLAWNGTSERWEGSTPIAGTIQYFLQAVDGAGNVAQEDNKGVFYELASDLASAKVVTVYPGVANTLVYTDAQGNVVRVDIPADAVTGTTTLFYTPLTTATPPADLAFADIAFTLEAYRGGVHLSQFVFEQPITVTMHYTDASVAGMDESSLRLYYWDGGQWVDAACGAYDRHPDQNWLAVPVCHLSEFALFGEVQQRVYLPVVLRNR